MLLLLNVVWTGGLLHMLAGYVPKHTLMGREEEKQTA
jgi:hypothetical protein